MRKHHEKCDKWKNFYASNRYRKGGVRSKSLNMYEVEIKKVTGKVKQKNGEWLTEDIKLYIKKIDNTISEVPEPLNDKPFKSTVDAESRTGISQPTVSKSARKDKIIIFHKRSEEEYNQIIQKANLKKEENEKKLKTFAQMTVKWEEEDKGEFVSNRSSKEIEMNKTSTYYKTEEGKIIRVVFEKIMTQIGEKKM